MASEANAAKETTGFQAMLLPVSAPGVATSLKPAVGEPPTLCLNSAEGTGGDGMRGGCVSVRSLFACAQTLPGDRPSERRRCKALKQTHLCLPARPNTFGSQNMKSWHTETKRT